MSVGTRVRNFLCLASTFLIGVAGCSDDSSDDGMITLTGVAVNIDNAEPAVGVRVSMLDGSGQTDVATGTDGRWTLRVPRGSLFETVVDDFDEGTRADEWLAMINVDYPGLVFNESRGNLIVHACPRPGFHEAWSVDAWNDYLANCSDPMMPQFDTSTAEESGGILVILNPRSEGGACDRTLGISITTDNAAFPIGYANADSLQAGATCYFHPATTTQTVNSSIVWSFGASSFAGGDIVLTATDTNSARGLVYEPAVIPMMPGAATLVWLGSIDNEGSKHFLDVFCACGREIPVSCE